MLVSRPEVLRGVCKNWEQICLNSLNCRQILWCYALIADERSDVTDTAQFIESIRAIDSVFTFTKILKSITAGKYLFLKIKKLLASLELGWEKLANETNSGGGSANSQCS
jgi:hypothetical protein